MSDRLVSRETIEELRNAAETRDWNQWVPALERALAEVPPDMLLMLAEAVLRDGLPTFERCNPGEMWPRRALDGLETGLGPDDHPGPGGNSFASSVEDLVEARERTNDADRCRTLITSALSGSVMALMGAAWGEDHPAEWKRSHELHADGAAPGGADPRLGWHRDPRVKQIKIDGWNDLIDRIERLERPDTSARATPDVIPTGADPHDD